MNADTQSMLQQLEAIKKEGRQVRSSPDFPPR